MKKQSIIRVVSILAIVASIALAILLLTKKRTDMITVGTGGTKGMYYQYTKMLADIEKDKLSIRIKETEGSQANLRLIQQGYLDVAIVQSDTLYDAINGYGEYKDNAIGDKRNFSAVTYLYTESVQLIVRKDSGIGTVTDLKGKKVSVGQKESGIWQNVEDILAVHGLSFNDITDEYMSFEDSANALKNGSIDAFFITAGAPTKAITDLTESVDIKLLSFSEDDVNRVCGMNPGYVKVTLPAGTYKGQDQDINTVGVYAVVVVSKKLDDDTVLQIAEDFCDNSEEMNKNIVTDSAIDPTIVPNCVSIPFHRGAAEHFKEHGIEVEVDGGGK